MKKILIFTITISIIVALMITTGIITDFSFKDYLLNLEKAFTGLPSLPILNVSWGDFSITNWTPLGEFFKGLWGCVSYPFQLLIYIFKIIGALFMIGVN